MSLTKDQAKIKKGCILGMLAHCSGCKPQQKIALAELIYRYIRSVQHIGWSVVQPVQQPEKTGICMKDTKGTGADKGNGHLRRRLNI